MTVFHVAVEAEQYRSVESSSYTFCIPFLCPLLHYGSLTRHAHYARVRLGGFTKT